MAWGIFVLLGAVLGVLLGWLWSPFSHLQGLEIGSIFVAWIQSPGAYWPWLVFGAAIAGLAFYASQLLKNSN
jgi:hypothetical protein